MPRTHFFANQDEQPFKRFHWLTLFTTGMGVFTDGYDLSSIGVVCHWCSPHSAWRISPDLKAACWPGPPW